MFQRKKNRFVALEANEYIIRAIVTNGPDINQATIFEHPMEAGIFEGDIIRDEMALYEILKKLIHDWGIKRYDIRFFVSDSTVMMKTFEHPADLTPAKLKGYVEMELGRTIHLPFSDPLIDVYDEKPNDGEAMLFAVPSEEVTKMAGLLDDLSLHPTISDIRALSTIRFLEKYNKLDKKKSYLMTDWSINGVTISIYTPGKLEFLRYQVIETSMLNWRNNQTGAGEVQFYFDGEIEEYRSLLIDQVAEMERILNFYRFSLYKGEKAVDEIIIFGDSPELDYITTEMRANYVTPIKRIEDTMIQSLYPKYKAKHIPLIGLALKEAF